jgi:hypothetical protein
MGSAAEAAIASMECCRIGQIVARPSGRPIAFNAQETRAFQGFVCQLQGSC